MRNRETSIQFNGICSSQFNIKEHLFILSLDYSRNLIEEKSGFFQLNVRSGLGLVYVPANKWDRNEAPTTLSEREKYGGQFYWDLDSNLKYTDLNYGRFMTDIDVNLKLGLEFKFNVSSNLSFSLIPEVAQGLIELYRTDVWYTDYINGLSGHAVMSTRGSYYGLNTRMSYRF